MQTATNTEYAAYDYHYTALAANNTTINHYSYKGHEIEQKADGYHVNGCFHFGSMQQAKNAIDNSINNLSIDEALEAFRKKYHLTRVMVYANCLVYKTAAGKSAQCAESAATLIAQLGLPLQAVNTTFYTQDSFVVEGKK